MGEAKALRKEVKARLESESGGCMRLRDGRRGDHSHGKSRGQRVRDRSAVPGAYVSPLTPRTDARQWAATRHSAAPGAPPIPRWRATWRANGANVRLHSFDHDTMQSLHHVSKAALRSFSSRQCEAAELSLRTSRAKECL